MRRVLVGSILGVLVLGILLAGTVPASAADVYLRVCNKGDIPLYVAVVEVGGWLNPQNLYSWYEIEPGNTTMFGGCPTFFFGNPIKSYYYLAFGIRKPDGSFGIVKYTPQRAEGMGDIRYCLSREPQKKSGSESELMTCRGSEKLVPFYVGWRIYQYAELSLSLTVEPHIQDKIEVYLDRPQERLEDKPRDKPPILKLERYRRGLYVEIAPFSDGDWTMTVWAGYWRSLGYPVQIIGPWSNALRKKMADEGLPTHFRIRVGPLEGELVQRRVLDEIKNECKSIDSIQVISIVEKKDRNLLEPS